MARVRTRARDGERGKQGSREARREGGKGSKGSKGSKGREHGENILKIYLTRSKQGTLTVIEAREKPSA